MFAGSFLELNGKDKGWNADFWVPEVEESDDPRDVLRYLKVDYDLYQKVFLGLIYELSDR